MVMEQAYHWLQNFHITAEQVAEWTRNLPKGKSLIRWCLESGKIQPEAFLQWARQHYQLPVLNDQFNDFNIAQEISKRYGNIWPDHVFPFYEWDGILYLACLEPVEDFKSPQKHQWVLAPLPMICKLRGENAIIEEASIISDGAPSGLSTETLSSLNFNSVSVSPEKGPSPLEAPIGLSETPAAGLDFGSLSVVKDEPVGIIGEPPPPPTPLTAAMPAGMPPPPSAAAAPKPTAPPAGLSGSNHDQLVQFVFVEMGKHFDRSMILLFQDEKLQPWKWSPGWKIDSNRNKIIDLSSPSVFRIVNETKNSYHGHVVKNDINNAFFDTWNGSLTPEHLTIVPIAVGNSLAGMILGVCSKARGTMVSLSNIEQLGHQAAEQLIRLGPLKAA